MRRAILALGSLIALLVVFVFCVMQWPVILVNNHTLSLAARLASKRPGAPHIKWEQAKVEVHRRGFLSNQLVFNFRDLCFEDRSYGHGCFQQLDAAFTYGLHKALPVVLELGPVTAQAHEIALQIPGEKAAKQSVTVSKKPAPSQPTHLPALAADAKLEPMNVKVDHWVFTLPNLQATGSFALEGSSVLKSKILVNLKSHALGGALNSHAELTTQAQTMSGRLRGPWSAGADIKAASADGKSRLTNHSAIRPELNGQPGQNARPGHNDRYDFESAFHVFSPYGKSNLDLTGWALPRQEVQGEVRGNIEPAPAQRNSPLNLLSLLQMNRFQFEGCHFDLLHPDRSKQDGKFSAQCFVDAQIVYFRLYGKGQPPVKLWKQLGVELATDVTLPAPEHSSSPFKGDVVLKPRTDQSSPLQLAGQMASHFEFMPGQLPVPRQLQTAIDLSMSIPRFQKLVRSLSDTPIAVPAPLRDLEGETFTHLKGNLTLNEGGELALNLGSHLNHSPDHVNVSGNGHASFEALKTMFEKPPRLPQVDSKIDIVLDDIHLTLPKAGISAPPDQVIPDPRIHANIPNVETYVTKETQHGELAGIHYLLRVSTPQEHPIEIGTQFLKKPVTVGLDLSLREGRPWIGYATINGNKEPVGIPSSQMAGQAAEERTSPKLPFGFSELVSSLLTGAPFQWIATQPETGHGILPQKEESRVGSAIELRRRY